MGLGYFFTYFRYKVQLSNIHHHYQSCINLSGVLLIVPVTLIVNYKSSIRYFRSRRAWYNSSLLFTSFRVSISLVYLPSSLINHILIHVYLF